MRCNFCGHEARAFRDFGFRHAAIEKHQIVGAGWRPNARCSACGSLDRERHVALYLRLRTDLHRNGGTLLHVAPEQWLGRELRARPNIRYVSMDLKAPGTMVRMDLTRLGFPQETFDVIICNHVLEHVEDDLLAIRELWRVLKPGGWAVLQVPISVINETTYEDSRCRTEEDRIREFGQADHVRIYGADYASRLQRAGFRVKRTRSTEALGATIVRDFALIENEPMFVVVRPFTIKPL